MDNSDWQSGLTIAGRFEKLFDMDRYADCVFKVGSDATVKFGAHRIVLATASPIFEAMFYGNLANNENPIEIMDIQPIIFKLLLRYIYSDKLHITSYTEACELFYAANKYMLANLLKKCTKYIVDELKPENVCLTLELAKLHENKHILEECHKVIEEKTEEIFKFPSFLEADISTLEDILSKESLSVPGEIDVWRACVLWSSSNCKEEGVNAENQRHALQKLLPLIRFLTMTPKEFVEEPQKTNILTVTESHKIITSMATPETSNMPSNLCTNTNSRCRIFRRQQSCKIGNYEDTRNSNNGQSHLFFSCSSVIMLKGVRLFKHQNSKPAVTRLIICEGNSRIREGNSIIRDKANPDAVETSSEIRDYMFEDDVEIQPQRKYRLYSEFAGNSVFHSYDIRSPVVVNNVTFNFSRDESYCWYNYQHISVVYGFCPFAELLFSVV